jgi:uncharacterized protein YbbK (DUF523 family)
MKVLVSACLLGQPVRYDGGTCTVDSDFLKRWVDQELVIPFCPEVAGGLPVPRAPAEIRGGGGQAVLDGTSGGLAVPSRRPWPTARGWRSSRKAALRADATLSMTATLLADASPAKGLPRLS